jgi:hypothetical protein
MQFLAISRMRTDLFSDADFAPLLEDEAQRARTLYIEGVLVKAGMLELVSLIPLLPYRGFGPRS